MCTRLRMYVIFFFFKQKTAYEMRISDWSSDVCSSDLHTGGAGSLEHGQQAVAVIAGDDVTHRSERGEQSVENLDDGAAVLATDVRPDPGVAGRDAGHVAEAARSETPQGAGLGGLAVGEVHERRRRGVGDREGNRLESSH